MRDELHLAQSGKRLRYKIQQTVLDGDGYEFHLENGDRIVVDFDDLIGAGWEIRVSRLGDRACAALQIAYPG